MVPARSLMQRLSVLHPDVSTDELHMSGSLVITPRNLGSIRLPGYCRCCFKRMLGVRFHPPSCNFGSALFGDAQNCQEAVLGYFLERDGELPSQFAPFCDCKARVDCSKHWSKFGYLHPSGVFLRGSPDEVLKRKDGSICIIDHKTAHFNEKDPLHDQYETQVIGYANIAEMGLNLGEATLAGLLYWEAGTTGVKESPSDHYDNGKLWMPFSPKGLEIKIDYKSLDPLLKEAKDVWNAKLLPESRAGCDDCLKFKLLLALEQKMACEDKALFDKFGRIPEIRREIQQREYMRHFGYLSLLDELRERGDGMFNENGLIANWEFPPFQS
jgi:hypothetical protein